MLKTTGDIKAWYTTSPSFSGVLVYEFPRKRFQVETEINYTSFRDAGLQNREFRWLITGERVKSPNAKASMGLTGITVNGVLNFTSSASSTFVPYLTVGIGFHRYKHSVSGLIWPGQLERPLDPMLLLPSYKDSGTGQSISIGCGISKYFSKRFVVDVRAQWRNFSEVVLRPLDAWELELFRSASGVQALLGFKYKVL